MLFAYLMCRVNAGGCARQARFGFRLYAGCLLYLQGRHRGVPWGSALPLDPFVGLLDGMVRNAQEGATAAVESSVRRLLSSTAAPYSSAAAERRREPSPMRQLVMPPLKRASKSKCLY